MIFQFRKANTTWHYNFDINDALLLHLEYRRSEIRVIISSRCSWKSPEEPTSLRKYHSHSTSHSIVKIRRFVSYRCNPILDYALQSRQREAWMWFQFQSDDLLRANTSHLRIMPKGVLAAWIEPRFGIPVLLTSCQKGPQKCSGNWSPMCSLCSLTSLFEVFCLEPSKSWFQTTSRQNAVSWVHGTFAEINYYPEEQQ